MALSIVKYYKKNIALILYNHNKKSSLVIYRPKVSSIYLSYDAYNQLIQKILKKKYLSKLFKKILKNVLIYSSDLLQTINKLERLVVYINLFRSISIFKVKNVNISLYDDYSIFYLFIPNKYINYRVLFKRNLTEIKSMIYTGRINNISREKLYDILLLACINIKRFICSNDLINYDFELGKIINSVKNLNLDILILGNKIINNKRFPVYSCVKKIDYINGVMVIKNFDGFINRVHNDFNSTFFNYVYKYTIKDTLIKLKKNINEDDLYLDTISVILRIHNKIIYKKISYIGYLSPKNEDNIFLYNEIHK